MLISSVIRMNLYCCVLSWLVSQMSYEKVFHENNEVSCMTFQATQLVCWVKSIDMKVCLASWLSFHTLFLYSFHLAVFYYCPPLHYLLLTVCSCLLSSLSLFSWCSSCVLWVLVLLLWTILFVYDIRLFLMCSRIASNGSVCLFACFVC